MTQTSTTTNTEIIPTRIASDHYQTPSFTETDKIYNQHFDYDLKRWNCDCPDHEYRKNLNCKHAILLRTYIKKEKSAAQLEQHSTRISSLETELANLRDTVYAQNELVGIKDQQIIILQDKMRSAEYQMKQYQERLDDQRELIAALQTSICKFNERTINHDMQIEQQQKQIETWELVLKRVHRETEDTAKAQGEIIAELSDQIDDQAQQIDRLRKAVSSQPQQEQIVRIVVEQPAPARAACQQSEEPAAMEIREVRNDKGKLITCKVGKFTVKVSGTCAGSCDCSTGLMDRRCPHIAKVDEYLSK